MANFNEITKFTKVKEGGLSRATTDNASSYPSPYTYQGVKGWHTNKGVTYRTFKDSASKYGYVDNAENFINMPDDIWMKIAKGNYWDVFDLDNSKSQGVANIMFSWIWGGWSPSRLQKYFKSKGIDWSTSNRKQVASIFNQLVDKYGEKQIIDELIEQKRQYLIGLNQPANQKGWLKRLDDLKNLSYTYIGKTGKVISTEIENVKKSPFKTGILTALLLVSGYIILTQTKIIKLK